MARNLCHLGVSLVVCAAAGFFNIAAAQNCIDIGGASPTNRAQNFDSLGISSAPQNSDAANIIVINPTGPRRYLGKFDNAIADSGSTVNLPGWALFEEGSHTSSVSGRYAVADGSNSGGNTYSFGSAGAGERALGSLNDDTVSLNILGACFRNTTGTVVESVRIGYVGEMWRRGGSATPDRLNFQTAVNAANIYNGAFMDVDYLDFSTPNLAAPAGARDGNAAANRTLFPLLLVNVSLAPNDRLYVRWVDSNIAGADDGLAIDDFEIQLSSPLAAEVSISGRVTRADGSGIAGARVIVAGAAGVVGVTVTNPFGYYRISGIQAGAAYTATVLSKRHRFTNPTRVLTLDDEATSVDFVADP